MELATKNQQAVRARQKQEREKKRVEKIARLTEFFIEYVTIRNEDGIIGPQFFKNHNESVQEYARFLDGHNMSTLEETAIAHYFEERPLPEGDVEGKQQLEIQDGIFRSKVKPSVFDLLKRYKYGFAKLELNRLVCHLLEQYKNVAKQVYMAAHPIAVELKDVPTNPELVKEQFRKFREKVMRLSVNRKEAKEEQLNLEWKTNAAEQDIRNNLKLLKETGNEELKQSYPSTRKYSTNEILYVGLSQAYPMLAIYNLEAALDNVSIIEKFFKEEDLEARVAQYWGNELQRIDDALLKEKNSKRRILLEGDRKSVLNASAEAGVDMYNNQSRRLLQTGRVYLANFEENRARFSEYQMIYAGMLFYYPEIPRAQGDVNNANVIKDFLTKEVGEKPKVKRVSIAGDLIREHLRNQTRAVDDTITSINKELSLLLLDNGKNMERITEKVNNAKKKKEAEDELEKAPVKTNQLNQNLEMWREKVESDNALSSLYSIFETGLIMRLLKKQRMVTPIMQRAIQEFLNLQSPVCLPITETPPLDLATEMEYLEETYVITNGKTDGPYIVYRNGWLRRMFLQSKDFVLEPRVDQTVTEKTKAVLSPEIRESKDYLEYVKLSEKFPDEEKDEFVKILRRNEVKLSDLKTPLPNVQLIVQFYTYFNIFYKALFFQQFNAKAHIREVTWFMKNPLQPETFELLKNMPQNVAVILVKDVRWSQRAFFKNTDEQKLEDTFEQKLLAVIKLYQEEKFNFSNESKQEFDTSSMKTDLLPTELAYYFDTGVAFDVLETDNYDEGALFAMSPETKTVFERYAVFKGEMQFSKDEYVDIVIRHQVRIDISSLEDNERAVATDVTLFLEHQDIYNAMYILNSRTITREISDFLTSATKASVYKLLSNVENVELRTNAVKYVRWISKTKISSESFLDELTKAIKIVKKLSSDKLKVFYETIFFGKYVAEVSPNEISSILRTVRFYEFLIELKSESRKVQLLKHLRWKLRLAFSAPFFFEQLQDYVKLYTVYPILYDALLSQGWDAGIKLGEVSTFINEAPKKTIDAFLYVHKNEPETEVFTLLKYFRWVDPVPINEKKFLDRMDSAYYKPPKMDSVLEDVKLLQRPQDDLEQDPLTEDMYAFYVSDDKRLPKSERSKKDVDEDPSKPGQEPKDGDRTDLREASESDDSYEKESGDDDSQVNDYFIYGGKKETGLENADDDDAAADDDDDDSSVVIYDNFEDQLFSGF